ncbi:MAG: RNA-guided pseudouridylation complex pseudouridine synthase subunit Cbf5, partial [Candidatus Hydrothermarchaeota archaeon]|nr:RNA-guided pseudouridylation complex pseudouridine synthase subunit Cbf5 [Candidatus Hydrothermarchaeota archaeon]
PTERSIEEHLSKGVINLDKPRGPTSHEVAAWVKGILKIKKAGHGGTLDPRVNGVLPITLEESTKIVKVLLNAGKEYVCAMRLHSDSSRHKIGEALSKFVGEIYQRPPVKSAVKRQLRTRRIYYINLLEVDNRDVLFKVGCEAGTYIRKLCHDIGEVLGLGAHMLELRRTKSGIFDESTIITLHDLADAYAFYRENGREDFLRKVVIPVEEALAHLPLIIVRDGAIDALCHGANLAIPGIVKLDSELNPGTEVALMTLKGELIAIGSALMDTKKILIDEKGIAVRTKRVIMKPGTYPRKWHKREENA